MLPEDFQERLQALSAQFQEALPDRLRALERELVQLRQGQGDWAELRRQLHSLAGSAGTFGLEVLSGEARALEQQVLAVCEGELVDWEALEEGVSRLQVEADPRDDRSADTSGGHSLDWLAEPAHVLVAEDDELSRRVLVSLLQSMGHEVTAVADGEAALSVMEAARVDLVLMDVLMPGMGGLETVRRLRSWELDADRPRVPVIFLTADEDPFLLHEAIRCGGDDLLVKPCPPVALDAKIHAVQRSAGMARQLASYRREMDQELRLAERVMNVSLSANDPDFPGLQWKKRPAGRFSGDAVFYRRSGELGYLLVADFTGHGLPAALGTLIAGDVFHDLAEVACPGELLLRALNKRLYQHLPTEFFCAACLVVIGPGEVKIWNRGLPDVWWGVPGESPRLVESGSLPLGVISEEYDDTCLNLPLDASGRLLIATDGVSEASSPAGEALGSDVLPRWFGAAQPLERILAELDNHLEGHPPQDDVTLVLWEAGSWNR